MKISEIFYSIQGEGFLAGVPAVFVRLAGCSLRCRWCDTKYAWDQSSGQFYTVDKVVVAVEKFKSRFVVITGGEPMMESELPQLAKKLKALGKHVTIETAGIAFVGRIECDLMSISPKLSNSQPADPQLAKTHEDSRLDTAVLRELIDNYDYQLKFVVDSAEDLPEIKQTLKDIGHVNSEKVMLMPQAASRDELLAKSSIVAELCKNTGFAFSPRLHVLLWDNQPGT